MFDDKSQEIFLPVTMRDIGDELIQTINSRDVHRALHVGRDHSTWIKGRIKRSQFREGVDYMKETCSPNPGSKMHGGHNAIEYHVTVDMAEHLALMENNPKGHAFRPCPWGGIVKSGCGPCCRNYLTRN